MAGINEFGVEIQVVVCSSCNNSFRVEDAWQHDAKDCEQVQIDAYEAEQASRQMGNDLEELDPGFDVDSNQCTEKCITLGKYSEGCMGCR